MDPSQYPLADPHSRMAAQHVQKCSPCDAFVSLDAYYRREFCNLDDNRQLLMMTYSTSFSMRPLFLDLLIVKAGRL